MSYPEINNEAELFINCMSPVTMRTWIKEIAQVTKRDEVAIVLSDTLVKFRNKIVHGTAKGKVNLNKTEHVRTRHLLGTTITAHGKIIEVLQQSPDHTAKASEIYHALQLSGSSRVQIASYLKYLREHNKIVLNPSCPAKASYTLVSQPYLGGYHVWNT